jgi:hypothetical protein
MKALALKIREEVRLMLVRLHFNSSEGAYVEGELAAIEIVPKRKKGAALCDLHFRVIPYRLEKNAPAEVLARAREACREALFDPNPNVRFAAHHYFDSLKPSERVRRGDMEGLIVQLHGNDERGDEILIEGLTDRDGEVWFSNVSQAAACRLTLVESIVIEPPLPQSSWIERQLPLAAKSPNESPPRAEGESEPRVFYLPDRRVIAILEEIVGGGAVLTVVTETEEFSGTAVRFECGRERGEVKLEPAETDGTWSGQYKLNHSFKELAADVPTFEIIPPQQEE